MEISFLGGERRAGVWRRRDSIWAACDSDSCEKRRAEREEERRRGRAANEMKAAISRQHQQQTAIWHINSK
jgi:hypothetical protein